MTTRDWIVCESGTRWVAALRWAVSRQGVQFGAATIREARSLRDAGQLLAENPTSLVAVETSEKNFADVLGFCSDVVRRWPQARTIALVEPSLRGHAEALAALREAGAIDLVTSPRRIGSVLTVGGRHAEWLAANGRLSLPWATRVRQSLPWQSTRRPLG